MLKHSKKRNIGLINEFFSRYIAKAIIDSKDNNITLAKEIYKKHFNKSTDLAKELKLFEALFDTRMSSRQSAVSLVNEVKNACKLQSQERLDLEKTALLHEINSRLEDAEFFNRPIKNYQMFATVQILLNHWRGKFLAENISEAAMLEDRLIQHLTRTESLQIDSKAILEMKNTDIDKLVLKIMSDKINANFQKNLNETQKKILKLYVFANTESRQELKTLLESLQQNTISLIDKATENPKFLVSESALKPILTEDKFSIGENPTLEKLSQIRKLLTEDYSNLSHLTDNMIIFYMSVSKLQKELV